MVLVKKLAYFFNFLFVRSDRNVAFLDDKNIEFRKGQNLQFSQRGWSMVLVKNLHFFHPVFFRS